MAAKQKIVRVGSYKISNALPFVFIGGPCVIESERLAVEVARKVKKITSALRIPYIFKSSYDKANRSSIKSFRGPGLKEGLRVLARVKHEVRVPVLTDVHSVHEVADVAKVVDLIQIPAFLCRQTDLVFEAARSGCAVNIKKGQFMSPWEMKNVVEKVREAKNERLLLTERGSTFGYNNLVVDMRGLEIMKGYGYPIVFDATHAVQIPGGKGTASGGNRECALPLSKAAISLGIAGIFMEVHPNPARALSDGANSIRLKDLPEILRVLRKLDNVAKAI